jgi:hypothetical protein
MTQAWRIDSLDARAGAAVASWRGADLALPAPDMDCPAVFVTAPYFQPQAVRGRAIGFGASRGPAQLGLFIGETEAGFDSLLEVQELVRRAYLSSGGGDQPGGGGIDGRPRPPDEPEGPVEEPEPQPGEEDVRARKGSAIAALRVWSEIALGFAEAIHVGQEGIVPTRNITPPSVGPQTGPAGAGMIQGYVILNAELLRRRPPQRDSRAFVDWVDALARLDAAAARLGLWNTSPPWRTVKLSSTLEGLDLPLVRRFHQIQDTDPLDDLSAWPLPADLAALVGAGGPDRSTCHLVGAATGAPLRVLAPMAKASDRAMAVLVFAAARLAAIDAGNTALLWRDSRMNDVWFNQVEQAAMRWLADQMPRMIFPEAVEAVIADAAAVSP